MSGSIPKIVSSLTQLVLACRLPDSRAAFDFALEREAEIAKKNDRRQHHRTNDEPTEEDENKGSEETEGKRDRGRGRYYGGGSMSLYQRLVMENRARENPAERDRLGGALQSLRRRQKWTMPTFVNFTTQDAKRYVGPVVEGWPPSRNR